MGPIASFLVDDLRTKVRALRDREVPFLGADDLPSDLEEKCGSLAEAMQVGWKRDPESSARLADPSSRGVRSPVC